MPFYSFDTSSILNGRRDLLRPTTFPTLWQNIETMITAGSIRCVDLVLAELKQREDESHAWAKSQAGLFEPLTLEVQQAVRAVLAQHPKMVGVGSGRSGADPFVVALALARGGVVVTEETLTRNLAKPKIPDVCGAMRVPCVNLADFVRDQGWVFR